MGRKYSMTLQALLLVLWVVGTSTIARADYESEFIRVTCVPQNRYFAIETTWLHSYVTDGGDPFDPAVWAKQGYLDPASLRYECKLPNSNYVVTSSKLEPRASGMCGGDPPVTLSVTRDGKPLVKDVVFGGACGAGAGVTKILIEDEHAGWHSGMVQVCMVGGGDGPEDCEVLQAGVVTAGIEPVTQNAVDNCRAEKAPERYKCLWHSTK